MGRLNDAGGETMWTDVEGDGSCEGIDVGRLPVAASLGGVGSACDVAKETREEEACCEA